MTDTADILIIGGGIAGFSLAAAIAGRASVVVLEAEDAPFHHTSSRSAQQMQPTYGPAEVRALTAASIPMVAAIAEGLDVPIFTPRPLLWLHHSPDPLPFEALLTTVPGLVPVGADEAVRLLPAVRRETLVDAALDSSAVEVDVPVLLDAYRAAAVAAGARIVLGARADGAQRIGDVWRVTAGGATVEAPIVVDAAGAWTETVAGLFGARSRGLVPKRRTVAIATAAGRAIDPAWPMATDVADRYYFRPRGGEMLTCGLEDTPSEPEDARPLPEVAQEAVDRVNAVTDLQLERPRSSWTGLRTVSPDTLPIVGFDEEVPGLYWLGGQGGYGIQTSAALAAVTAADLLGVPAGIEGVDGVLDALSPARFAGAARVA